MAVITINVCLTLLTDFETGDRRPAQGASAETCGETVTFQCGARKVIVKVSFYSSSRIARHRSFGEPLLHTSCWLAGDRINLCIPSPFRRFSMHARHIHAGAQAKPCLRSTSFCTRLQPAQVQRRHRGPTTVRAGVVDTLLKPLTQSGQVPLSSNLCAALCLWCCVSKERQ